MVTRELIDKILLIAWPYISGKDKTLEHRISFDDVCSFSALEFSVYTKLREVWLEKLLSEIYGETAVKFRTELSCNNGLLTYGGFPLSEAAADLFYFISDDAPSGGWSWRDSFYINGGGMISATDITDFCLLPGGEGIVDSSYCNGEEDEKKMQELLYASVKEWWEEPYKDEMATSLVSNGIINVLETCIEEESYIDYIYMVNVAVVPFINWLKRSRKLIKKEDRKVIGCALNCITAFKYNFPLYPSELGHTVYEYTQNLFYIGMGVGNRYDSTLTMQGLSLQTAIAFRVFDDLMEYLDERYNIFSEDIKKFYKERGR